MIPSNLKSLGFARICKKNQNRLNKNLEGLRNRPQYASSIPWLSYLPKTPHLHG